MRASPLSRTVRPAGLVVAWLGVALVATLVGWAVPGPVAAAADVAAADPPAIDVPVADFWSAAGTFRTSDGWYASPIHATLLPDGRIFFIGIARDADPPESATIRRVAWIFAPPPLGSGPEPTTVIEEIAEPIEFDGAVLGDWIVTDDFSCTSSVLDSEGRMVTAGGTRSYLDLQGTPLFTMGLPYETVFDGTTWANAGRMVATAAFDTPSRWYPTTTRLPDGQVLVTGGFELLDLKDLEAVVGSPHLTSETFDPATGARAVFSDTQQTPPAIHARDYTHAFVLPYADAPNDLLFFGEPGYPVYASSATPGTAWTTLPIPRPGGGGTSVNWGTSSAQLPLRVDDGEWGYSNGSVLMASGNMHTGFDHSADVYDAVEGRWWPTQDLGVARHHPSTVVLPDSRILILNGHDMNGMGVGVQKAQYLDPRNGFALSTGSATSGVVRGYHSVAVLLPDGRVLVAGGRDQMTNESLEKPTYQIYTPDYVARTRPVIADAPTAMDYGSLVSITTIGAKPTELVLLALGSMTHSFDNSQRAVELPVGHVFSNAAGAHWVIGGAPQDSHVAPPGYYLLYALDADGVPSVGRLVKVG